MTCSKLLQLFFSMSSPSFLLANDTNHALLQSLLESLNAIVEHQFKTNPMLIYHILKSRKRFEALRSFTLESGQAELERMAQRRKDILGSPEPDSTHSRESFDTARNPASRTASLNSVPEQDDTFAIGGEDSDEDDAQHTPAPSSPSMQNSRAPSIASSIDDNVPVQLRGMSEKARGKMPAGQPSFSRVNSNTSLGGYTGMAASGASSTGFTPTTDWVRLSPNDSLVIPKPTTNNVLDRDLASRIASAYLLDNYTGTLTSSSLEQFSFRRHVQRNTG